MERPFLNRKGRDNSIFAGAIKSPCVAPIAERQKKKLISILILSIRDDFTDNIFVCIYILRLI